MDAETMKQWYALIEEYNERTSKVNIEFSNKRKELEDEQSKAKAELEKRKHEFNYKIKQEQNIITQKYVDAYRELTETRSDIKRAIEAERQAAYLKFRLEHNVTDGRELVRPKIVSDTKPIQRKSRVQKWLAAINEWLRPVCYNNIDD